MERMAGKLTLRPATREDAELLLGWRNDPRTREASHDTRVIPREEHLAWLSSVLADPDRQLFVAEEDGVPVGTVRADFRDGAWVLSWTVAPDARGRGVGKRMVALLVERLAGPVRAEIKVGNMASVRIAEHAGLVLDREEDGVLHYHRPARR